MGYMHLFKLVFSFSLDACTGVELLYNIVVLFLAFEEHNISYENCANLLPHTVFMDSLFSTSSPTFIIYGLQDYSSSEKCEVISHCGFDLIFCDD